MKKFFITFFILISISLSQNIYAEVLSGSGIIPGQIWYSKDSLIEGDTVAIHTAIWNDKSYDISVKVEFYDGKVLLGERNVDIKSNELKDVNISWKITAGEHNILAKISSSLKDESSGAKESITLTRVSTMTSKNSVEKVIKNEEGETVSLTNEVKDKVDEFMPEGVSDFVSTNFNVVEKFRNDNSAKVSTLKDNAKDELEVIKNTDKNNNDKEIKKSFEESTKEPIVYVKLFLLSVLSFIMNNSLVFYGLSVLIVFYVLRFIYRKIRHR